jgi:N-acetylmuramoyl-L-alanine amidase
LFFFNNTQLFANDNANLVQYRYADNENYSRIVFDFDDKIIDYEVKSKDHNLILKVKSAYFSATHGFPPKNSYSSIIKDVIYKETNNNLDIIIKLNNDIIIKKTFIIKRNPYPYYRLVIDFQKKPKKKPIIAIDAGHGGEDAGAKSPYINSREKDIALIYAYEIKRKLEKTGEYNVFLTRNGDYFISLDNRIKKAQKHKADLFISLHADSIDNPNTKGLSIYTANNISSDDDAALLAQNLEKYEQNKKLDYDDDGNYIPIIGIDNMFETKKQSEKFAKTALSYLGKYVNLLNHSHRFADFKVLRTANIPSVLIELGYLSNKEEAKLLATDNYKGKITSALAIAIDEYCNKHIINKQY